ncbi:MAG: cobalamin B12-binding domain-containing protein [Gammaproteobacteria bacterium]|nr:cobalamin B12-binding domain-containing protein [Gammaproteobacteria bacterium]MBU1441839.1 cobalamin B12-binding domain-containing protein [Gammaproteobacteria bacterium]MBU2408729.1 cobalamin B12-binding domain-containing protein [Gammaproteobacteria bacterium]
MPQPAREVVDSNDSGGQSTPSPWPAERPTPLRPPGWAVEDRRAAADRQFRLTRTLEVDIIPRLVDVHRALPTESPAPPSGRGSPTAQDVEDFVQLVLAREHVPSQAFVEVLHQRGMSVETVYLDLLAPAARHLNYLWTQDLCDFTQVTLGLARLQRLLHELSPAMGTEGEARSNARRVLLMPACGEQQTFGLSMVAEFFHHAGWEVDCGSGVLECTAVDSVKGGWFDVLGLSVGISTRLDKLRACIVDVRAESRNKDILVLVGGPIFAGHPDRVKFVGADAAGLDGKLAPSQAERLIAYKHPPR